MVFRLPPAAVAPGPLAAATEAPSTAKAATDTAATDDRHHPGARHASPQAGQQAPSAPRGAAWLPDRPRPPGAAARPARTARAAKAATSITPATIPAVVRTSLNPNRPIHNDSR